MLKFSKQKIKVSNSLSKTKNSKTNAQAENMRRTMLHTIKGDDVVRNILAIQQMTVNDIPPTQLIKIFEIIQPFIGKRNKVCQRIDKINRIIALSEHRKCKLQLKLNKIDLEEKTFLYDMSSSLKMGIDLCNEYQSSPTNCQSSDIKKVETHDVDDEIESIETKRASSTGGSVEKLTLPIKEKVSTNILTPYNNKIINKSNKATPNIIYQSNIIKNETLNVKTSPATTWTKDEKQIPPTELKLCFSKNGFKRNKTNIPLRNTAARKYKRCLKFQAKGIDRIKIISEKMKHCKNLKKSCESISKLESGTFDKTPNNPIQIYSIDEVRLMAKSKLKRTATDEEIRKVLSYPQNLLSNMFGNDISQECGVDSKNLDVNKQKTNYVEQSIISDDPTKENSSQGYVNNDEINHLCKKRMEIVDWLRINLGNHHESTYLINPTKPHCETLVTSIFSDHFSRINNTCSKLVINNDSNYCDSKSDEDSLKTCNRTTLSYDNPFNGIPNLCSGDDF